MIGEYTVKIGNKLFDYTNANDIPKKFDHLIKFVPTEPPEPHTQEDHDYINTCLLYTSPSPRDLVISRMPSSA